MKQELKTKLIVRSYELDSLNHVNHAVYLNYLEYARIQYLKDAGIPFDSFIKDGIYIVIVNMNINYRKSAKMYDELEIIGEIKKSGYSSITMHQKIVHSGTKELICDAEGTYVFVDAKTEKAIPIPDRFIKAFSLKKN